MIKKYENISIIYGASGRDCAVKMEQELKRRHIEEFYPIKPYILANEVLSSSSILDTVKRIITASSACIVILTFDDVNQTRVRQNVLVELGIALTLIDLNNCFFISEKAQLPDDFPSDLKGVINPNYFDKSNPDEIVKKTCDAIIRHLGLKHYRDILKDNRYIYDYRRVLDDIPLHIFEKKADTQMEHILDEWEANIASFEFVVERIMYLVERLKFFPDFNCNDRFFAFLNRIEDLIKPREHDFEYYDSSYLITTCNFVTDIINYSRIKLNKQVLACIADPASNRDALRRHQIEFKEIADNIRSFIESFEDGTFEYNWMIKVMAYEYAGLAYMKYIACTDKYDESILALMNYIIGCYENVIRVGKRNDPYSAVLWTGYAQYDLTRAYENLYKVTKDAQYLAKMGEYSQASIVTRRKWFSDNQFKGVFSSALSFEYFLVYKYEYELRHKYSTYSSDTPDHIIGGLVQLKSELSRYCETAGLGRLYDIRDGIDDLIRHIENK